MVLVVLVVMTQVVTSGELFVFQAVSFVVNILQVVQHMLYIPIQVSETVALEVEVEEEARVLKEKNESGWGWFTGHYASEADKNKGRNSLENGGKDDNDDADKEGGEEQNDKNENNYSSFNNDDTINSYTQALV